MKIKVLIIVLLLCVFAFYGCSDANVSHETFDGNVNVIDNETGENVKEENKNEIIKEIESIINNNVIENSSNDENNNSVDENVDSSITNSNNENVDNTNEDNNENTNEENFTNDNNKNDVSENTNEENEKVIENEDSEEENLNIENNEINNDENNNNTNEENVETNNSDENNENNVNEENESSTIENPYSFVFTNKSQSNCEYNFESKEITLSLSENLNSNFVKFKAYIYFEEELYSNQKFEVVILDSENYDYSVTVSNIYIEIYKACDFYVGFNNSTLNIMEIIHIYAV